MSELTQHIPSQGRRDWRRKTLLGLFWLSISITAFTFTPVLGTLSGAVLIWIGPLQRVATYAGAARLTVWMYDRGARHVSASEERVRRAWRVALAVSTGGFLSPLLGHGSQDLLLHLGWRQPASLIMVNVFSGLVGGSVMTVVNWMTASQKEGGQKKEGVPFSRRSALVSVSLLALIVAASVVAIGGGLLVTIADHQARTASPSLIGWGLAAATAVPALCGGIGGGSAHYVARQHSFPTNLFQWAWLSRSIRANFVSVALGSLIGVLVFDVAAAASGTGGQEDTVRGFVAQTAVLLLVEWTKQYLSGRALSREA